MSSHVESALRTNSRAMRWHCAGRGLFGMPLNMPFTEIGDVIQRVKATGTHETKNPDAQFALAVSIFPYTNNVLSVWVYFAYTVPRMNVIK